MELGEIASIDRQGVEPASLAPDTLYLGLEHIERGGRIIGHDTVVGAGLVSTKFWFSQEHVLFGKLRPNLGKVSRPNIAGVCSTDILPIRPGPDLDRDYLAHYLGQSSMVAFAASRTSGANLPRLSPAVLSTFPIPLPPLPEQRRIAAILNQADALRVKYRQIVGHLDNLCLSIFRETFAKSQGSNGGTVRLNEVAEWKSGGTPPRTDLALFEGELPWFSSGELGPIYVSDAKEHVSESAIARTAAKRIPANSIMLGMYDTAALKSSITTRPASCNQAVVFATPDPALHDALFIYWAIQSVRAQVLDRRRGIRQQNLNLSMVREIEIPRVPILRQREFAESVRGVIMEARLATDASLAGDCLFASLQSFAFREGLR